MERGFKYKNMKKIKIVLMMSMVIAVLLASISVFYYYVIYLPQIQNNKQSVESQKQQAEKLEKENNEILLDSCLEVAEIKAENQKESYMENIVGTKTSVETIQWSLDEINERLYKEKEECFKKYK